MQPYSELELYHLAMEDPWFAADPAAEFVKARKKHPWLAASNYGPVITQYSVIREIFAMENKIGSAADDMVEQMGVKDTPWGGFQHRQMLNLSGIEHKRTRDILAPAFTPRQANRHRDLMRQTVNELLDEWAPKGKFDFEEFVSWYPISVMCAMIGAPTDALPSLKTSLEALGQTGDRNPTVLGSMQQGIIVMEDFSARLIAEREAVHKLGDDKDLLDVLLNFKKEGNLSLRELLDLLIFLFVAGYDTSKNVLTLVMYEMVNHHDLWVRCAEDLAYCSKVADETMRLHGPVNSNRLVTEDIVHQGVMLPTGTTVWLPLSIIGQDPGTANDADQFNPDRQNKQTHVGFGLGGHMCLGQFIARAQLAEGLHQIAKRITKPTSPGPDAWRSWQGVWGIKGLPIEFLPA